MKNVYHICYVYICNYHILKNVDLIFDHHYDFKYDCDGKDVKITISKRSDIPDDFWGEGIYSVSGLFGNNGAGKSTVLSFLMDALVDGANADVDGLFVFENNGRLYIFTPRRPKDHRRPKIENKDDIEYEWIDEIKKINTFYYSGCFRSEYSPASAVYNGFAGSYNASDSFLLLRKDRQDYLNDYDPAGQRPLSEYLRCHIAQTHLRICKLLSDSTLRTIIKKFILPKYIVISINDAGFMSFRREKELYEQIKFITDESDTLNLFIYHNLLNEIHDCYPENQWNEQLSNGFFKKWHNLPKERNVLEQFRKFISIYGTADTQKLMLIYQVLSQLLKIAKFKKRDRKGFYYIPVEEIDSLENFTLLLKNRSNRFSQYFNLIYAQSLDDDASSIALSSGEQDLLNLFSRIYDAVILNPGRKANSDATTLFLLDEAENTFHPEWQRKYVNLILSFFNCLKQIKPDLDFQIILTSHSPILLSDLPSNCANCLKVSENKVVNSRKAIENTFAQNIFFLYRESFFLTEGLIGEFAFKKIEEIYEEIQSEPDKNLVQKIDLIKDERIHKYLFSEYFKNSPNREIEYYKNKIKQLEDKSND